MNSLRSNCKTAAFTLIEMLCVMAIIFVGTTARPRDPNSILAGDGNITSDASGRSSVLRHTVGNPVRWTHELHRYKGNLLFADGRVEESNDRSLASGGQALALHSAPEFLAASVPGPAETGVATRRTWFLFLLLLLIMALMSMLRPARRQRV